MGILKWYKRDPRAALKGMRQLTLEERGAYNTILDLIYSHDGLLQDDAREICHELRCNIRTWKRIKARLLELGKLYVHGGCLHNERADEEIVNFKRLVKLSAEAAAKRWATYNEIKNLPDGLAMQPTTRTVSLRANVVPLSGNRERKWK